jgi:uncharacterized protein YwgA
MNMATLDDIVRIIRLNGGRIIGKTRLQKTVYFLETLNLGSGFEFSYHHYGPYSEELANSVNDARALDMLSIEWGVSQEGAEYAIFLDKGEKIQEDEKPERDELRRAVLTVLRGYSSVELELAATSDFLEKHSYGAEAWSETRRRKFRKISEEGIARGKQLLQALREIRH